MLKTAICDLLNIEAPIIQAGMGSNFTSAELVAAVTNAGALGSLGAGNTPIDQLKRHLARIADLTGGSYAVSHLVTVMDEEAYQISLDAHPRAITFALDDGGVERIQRAHDAGALVIQQVNTVAQAEAAAAHGADIIIAQGGESGGFGGTVSTLPLVPQVVDAVRPVPVVAAGGISDGRGLAAALMLGAAGINIGTRFLASAEAPIADEWKQIILGAASEDAVKVDVFNDISPLPGTPGYGTTPRAIRTAFIDEWNPRRAEAREKQEELLAQIGKAGASGRFHELMPFAGQTTGAIREVRSAAELVKEIVRDAEALLSNAPALVK
jgi:nitronate monooxygenase/enoyl-[acyl-carrier protein] reductase II